MKQWLAPEVEELDLKDTAFCFWPWDDTSGEEEDFPEDNGKPSKPTQGGKPDNSPVNPFPGHHNGGPQTGGHHHGGHH